MAIVVVEEDDINLRKGHRKEFKAGGCDKNTLYSCIEF